MNHDDVRTVEVLSREEFAVHAAACLARRWAGTWDEYLHALESNLVHNLAK